MNQLLFGNDLVDTDDIRNAILISGEDAQRRIYFKGGGSTILRGEAMEAFEEWAKSLLKTPETDLCASCLRIADAHCISDSGLTFPDCYEARETAMPEELATVHSHMHPYGQEAKAHEHPHEFCHHYGWEESYPNEKDYSRSDTQ